MKTWVDDVLDALKWAWGTIYYAQDEPIDDDDRGEALEKIDAAIKAIPDEPEMVVLLKWLERRRSELRRGQHGGRRGLSWNLQIELGNKATMAEEVIAYIEEMGYKLEEE